MKRMTKPIPIKESGQAAIVGLVVALTVIAALALPAFEVARVINDRVLVASAAEDAAKAVAATPSTTKAELMGYLANAYPVIAETAQISINFGPQKVVPYTHHLNSGSDYVSRPSQATSRDVFVAIEVSKDFVTAAGQFIDAVTGNGGYSVSATGHAVIDETVSSGRW